MMEDNEGLSPQAYGVIVASFLTIAIAYTIRYGYGMLLPGMLAELHISKTEAGVISAFYFVSYTIFSPFVGLWSDRANPRILVGGFTALLSIGTIMMGYAQSLFAASFYFALVGFGHAACWAPVVAQVQIWVKEKHRGTVLAITTMGSSIGVAMLSLWLPDIVARWQYRGGWFVLGGVGCGVTVLNFLLLKKKEEPIGQIGTSEKGSATLLARVLRQYAMLLREKNLWLVGCSYACVGFTVLVPLTFLNVYATEELGLSLGVASYFFTIIAVSGMAGKLVLGSLSDKLTRISVMVICGLLLSFGCAGVVLLPTLVLKYVSVALIGCGFGAVWPVYAAVAVDLFPKNQAGSVIGLWTVFMGLGSIASPIICGLTIDMTHSYLFAFLCGCAGGIFAILLLWPVQVKRKKSVSP